MATIEHPGRHTEPSSYAPRRVAPRPNPVEIWLAGWRLAFRTGGREIRRARGRSALIMTMVGLPALLIIGVAVGGATPSTRSQLGMLLGTAQARVWVGDPQSQVAQDPQVQTTGSMQKKALTLPGHQQGSAWTADQLSTLLDRPVQPTSTGFLTLKGSADLRVAASSLPTTAMRGSGLIKRRDGNWPANDHEALITRDGEQNHHLQIGQTITVSRTDGAHVTRLKIVGLAAASSQDAYSHAQPLLAGELLVGNGELISASKGSNTDFLVYGSKPVPWSTVRKLNQYGLLALSQQAIVEPPAASAIDGSVFSVDSGPDSNYVAFVVLISAGVLFEAMLLAGPAFAISAARQRRTMGLLASNGADRLQLRRQLLGQALLLGVLAGAVGVVLGMLGGRYLGVVMARLTGAWETPMPITWWQPLIMFLATALASVVAALLPARGVGRLDLAAVLRGRFHLAGSHPVTRLAGALMIIAGLAVAVGFGFFGPAEMGPRYLMGIGTAAAFIGAILIIGTVLTGIGRLSSRLPLSVRLAARDAARQRGRTSPAIAAILVASGMFTIMSIAIHTDDVIQAQQYRPSTKPGWGFIEAGSQEAAEATVAEVKSQHPGWTITERRILGSYESMTSVEPSMVMALVPTGCSAAAAVDANESDGSCDRDRVDYGTTIMVAPADSALTGSGLSDADRRVLAGGGMLINQAAMHPKDGSNFTEMADVISDDHVRLAIGKYDGGRVRLSTQHELPTKIIGAGEFGAGYPWSVDQVAGWISSSTAKDLGLSSEVTTWDVRPSTGSISADDQRRVNERVPADAELSVERGYVSQTRPVELAMLGAAAALVIMAALISTALAQVESRPNLATLSAVGAPPGTRRRVAAVQASLTVIIGVGMGLVIGLIAGSAFAASNSPDRFTESPVQPGRVIAIPWLQLPVMLLGAALLAAVIATLGAWRSPKLTRRIE